MHVEQHKEEQNKEEENKKEQQKDEQQQREEMKEQRGRKKLVVTMGEVTDKNVNQLRRLNFEVFPVKYGTHLYHSIVTEYVAHSRLVYYNDLVIAAYTVRIEDYQGHKHAYILTFGVLPPYRKSGIGRQMMHALETDIKDNSQAKGIYLHMHVLNKTGKMFY